MSNVMKKWMGIALFLVCGIPLFAQKVYQISEVAEINLGDGRKFYSERKSEKPLNGEFRIIDGYRSEYVETTFKDGLFNGPYKEYKRNDLRVDGAYMEGRKNGTFHKYISGTVIEEYTFRNDTLDGRVMSYYQDGKVKREGNFKNGNEDGNFKEYHWEDGHLWNDENYVDGRRHGRQWKMLDGDYKFTETSYFNHGKPVGKYERRYTDLDMPQVLGQYNDNGGKTGTWTKFNDLGDTVYIEHYSNGQLEGERIVFASTGIREEVEQYKNGQKNGICRLFDSTGKLQRETCYKNNRRHGKERVWVTSNQHNYIETYTYVNDRRHGPYEAVYVADKTYNIKEGALKTTGEYRNDNRFGHWVSYAPNGKIEREWDE